MVKSFLKDHITDSLAFFSAAFLIGLFYYISVGKRIEIIYPFSIVIFVYLIWMLIRFIEYRRIYKDLEDMAQNHYFQSAYHLELNNKIFDTMKQLHMNYLDKLSEAENNKKKERRFLSLWIHNMKTPITVTDILLQRMEQKEIEVTAALQALQEENKKLLVHLDHALNIVRLEEFAKDYIPEQLDLIQEIKTIVNKNKSLFIYSHVFPNIVTDLQEAKVLSDKKWNEHMINQFISNAVKYSKDEQGTSKNVYFIIEKLDKQIRLTIKDEGIGIPKHDLSKVCEPFFTGDNGRKGYQSSGIGLYFCKEVCSMLGHTFEISSEVMKGTQAKITYLAKL